MKKKINFTKIEYTWVKGFPTRGADVCKVGKYLNTLYKKNKKKLSPEIVAQYKNDSVIRMFFTHDPAKALKRLNILEARDLIQGVRIKVIGGDVVTKKLNSSVVETRAYESVQTAKDGRVYKQIQEIVVTPGLREQLISDILNDLKNWQKKCDQFEIVCDLADTIKEFIDRIEYLSKTG